MAKRIFINNLDTYVSQAIFQELRNDVADEEGNKPEDSNQIFGTYINKDSSEKPEGVKKMLKVSVKVRPLPILPEIQTPARRAVHLKLRPYCVRPPLRKPPRCEDGGGSFGCT